MPRIGATGNTIGSQSKAGRRISGGSTWLSVSWQRSPVQSLAEHRKGGRLPGLAWLQNVGPVSSVCDTNANV